MKRYLLLAAVAFSAAVHGLLAPEHLHEEPLLGVLFVFGAIVELALAVLLAARPSRAAIVATTLALAGMLVAYIPFVLFRVPGFSMTPEPLERVALLTKGVELAGLAVGMTLWAARPAPLSRRLAPAVATIFVACVAAAVAAPPSLAGSAVEQRSVEIPGTSFSPDALPVLVGDTVTWTNHDTMTHTVTGDHDEFDSDRLEPGAHFGQTFLQPGVYRYHCRIHRFMHGEIDVYAVALLGPDRSVGLGSTITLSGLVSADVRSVGLEQQQADGSYEGVASASPGADGAFSFPITVSGPARFRARAGDRLSDPVAVQPQPLVTMRLRRVDGRATAAIAAEPDQGGAAIALERYNQERYRWLPIRRAKLSAEGRVTLTVRVEARGVRLRAHLLRGRNGWGEATSAAVGFPR
jgi:plastocyanin